MNKKHGLMVIIICCLSLLGLLYANTSIDPVSTITRAELSEALCYLASDELEGRMSGKQGNRLAAAYIAKEFEDDELIPAFGDSYFQKFSIIRTNFGPNNERGNNFTKNIGGYFLGKNSKIIMVGAHMDHIGYGPRWSLDGVQGIHNGADDNASGTVALLEIAEAMSRIKDTLYHSILFVTFSAEEMGLVGAQYYVNHPAFSLTDHILMINLDMVGYLNRQNTVYFYGASNVETLRVFLEKENGVAPFNIISTHSDGGGSDHLPFTYYDIPTIFVHTGMHPYYHTVDDDAERIDYKGLTQITKLVFRLIMEADNRHVQ